MVYIKSRLQNKSLGLMQHPYFDGLIKGSSDEGVVSGGLQPTNGLERFRVSLLLSDG